MACAGQLGCVKCVLDHMLGDSQLTSIFEQTDLIHRIFGHCKDPDVPLDKLFQEEIVVSFLHSVASLLNSVIIFFRIDPCKLC